MTHFLDNWPKRGRLIALFTGNNDLTVAEIAKELGVSGFTVRGYAHALGIHRHPATIKRQRRAVGDKNSARRREEEAAKPRHAAWPAHTFEDDEWEARRPFNPDLRYQRRPVPKPEQTMAGVPSGWAA